MPAKVKFERVEELRAMLQKSQGTFLAEYRGMTVAQITSLRSQVREAGGEMKVAKNTLMKIALEQEGLPVFPEDMAAGPNVFTLAYGDPVAVAKVLRDFSKERTNKAFILKGEFWASQFWTSTGSTPWPTFPAKTWSSARWSGLSQGLFQAFLRSSTAPSGGWRPASTRSKNKKNRLHKFLVERRSA